VLQTSFEEISCLLLSENLFSSSASSERKFWGFLLFQKMLNDAAVYPAVLRSLFSQNLIRCLINHVSKEDRFLHRAAEKSLKSIQQTIEAHPSTAATIISGLVSGHGVYNFDQITKTKTIEKILSHVQAEYRESVFGALLSPILTVMYVSI
jgi:DNA polymerase phi